MRCFLLFFLTMETIGAAHAQGSTPLQNCVPQQEMQEVVASKRVVAPVAALNTARQQVPNADVVRANLCHSDNALVYVIVALRKDGRVVQVMIDGPSGRVKSVE
jgi:uncharacterized membrane protein YkoI